MKVIDSRLTLGNVLPNIAVMLVENARRFGDRTVVSEKIDGQYKGISWKDFVGSIENVAANLGNYGYKAGDKVMIYSKNCSEMLIAELAIMTSGGIAVPIFFNYNKETVKNLYEHSGARFIIVGNRSQLEKIDSSLSFEHLFVFDELSEEIPGITQFSELLKDSNGNDASLRMNASTDEICLNMFTSGTSGRQKCVQLTHNNILSQQAALKHCFDVNENDRFLSYMRWHHSFGGIFEIFNALY